LFARSWKHPGDLYDEKSHKAEKCAEVLVPDLIESQFVIGAYVAGKTALASFESLNTGLPVQTAGDIFF
jgi:hypothetical protein